MREYLERFDEAILLCLMVSHESILSIVQEGLKPSQFLHKISRKMPKAYVELKIKRLGKRIHKEQEGRTFRAKEGGKEKGTG